MIPAGQGIQHPPWHCRHADSLSKSITASSLLFLHLDLHAWGLIHSLNDVDVPEGRWAHEDLVLGCNQQRGKHNI